MGTSVSHHSIVDQAQWAEWSSESHPYSVGVEEEVMLLDPKRRWAPAQRIDDVLEMLPVALAGYVSAETHQAAIELRTDPHESVGRAVAQLRGQRVELADAAEDDGPRRRRRRDAPAGALVRDRGHICQPLPADTANDARPDNA